MPEAFGLLGAQSFCSCTGMMYRPRLVAHCGVTRHISVPQLCNVTQVAEVFTSAPETGQSHRKTVSSEFLSEPCLGLLVCGMTAWEHHHEIYLPRRAFAFESDQLAKAWRRAQSVGDERPHAFHMFRRRQWGRLQPALSKNQWPHLLEVLFASLLCQDFQVVDVLCKVSFHHVQTLFSPFVQTVLYSMLQCLASDRN